MTTDHRGSDRAALRIVKRGEQQPGERTPRSAPEQRFPPVVQVLNMTVPHIQERLQDIATMGFRRGLDCESICSELYGYARTLDYEATIGVQEVRTDQMPSFAGRMVASALMLVDLHPRATFVRLWTEPPAQS